MAIITESHKYDHAVPLLPLPLGIRKVCVVLLRAIFCLFWTSFVFSPRCFGNRSDLSLSSSSSLLSTFLGEGEHTGEPLSLQAMADRHLLISSKMRQAFKNNIILTLVPCIYFIIIKIICLQHKWNFKGLKESGRHKGNIYDITVFIITIWEPHNLVVLIMIRLWNLEFSCI